MLLSSGIGAVVEANVCSNSAWSIRFSDAKVGKSTTDDEEEEDPRLSPFIGVVIEMVLPPPFNGAGGRSSSRRTGPLFF